MGERRHKNKNRNNKTAAAEAAAANPQQAHQHPHPLPPISSFRIPKTIEADTPSVQSTLESTLDISSTGASYTRSGLPPLGGTGSTSNGSHKSPNQQQQQLLLTDDRIIQHLRDFYEDMDAVKSYKIKDVWRTMYERYCAASYCLIRPSGNPINVEGLVKNICESEAEVLETKLISVESIRIMAGGAVAVATYTVDQKYKYRGTLNEDRRLNSCVLEDGGGVIKICHEHAGSGESIPTKASRWRAA